MEAILGFTRENRWLSNFEAADVVYEGETYRTVEHGYMAAKTLDPSIRQQIQALATPGEARRLGKSIQLRNGWDMMRLEVMEQLNRQKWTLHEHLRSKLLDTGDAYLEETNWWHDNFWGVCTCQKCASVLAFAEWRLNHLGKIIMKIRNELRPIRHQDVELTEEAVEILNKAFKHKEKEELKVPC
jgi:hypothetical protein